MRQTLAGDGNCAFKHEEIRTVTVPLEIIGFRLTGFEISQPKPRILIYPDAAIVLIRRDNVLKLTLPLIHKEHFLIIARFQIPHLGQYPYLKKINNFRLGTVVLGMGYSCPWRHDLNFTGLDPLNVAHAVLMAQLTGERDRYYFHVLMGVCAETHAGLNHIVINYSQQTKSHALRIMVFSE